MAETRASKPFDPQNSSVPFDQAGYVSESDAPLPAWANTDAPGTCGRGHTERQPKCPACHDMRIAAYEKAAGPAAPQTPLLSEAAIRFEIQDKLSVAHACNLKRAQGQIVMKQCEDFLVDYVLSQQRASSPSPSAALRELLKRLDPTEPIVLQHDGPCKIWKDGGRCNCGIVSLTDELTRLLGSTESP